MTTSFKEIRFPERISFGAVGGAGWLTDVVTLESGFETRNQVLAQPRGRWEVSHAARMPAQYKLLRAFFNAVRGRTYGFRFKDWTDYEVTAGEAVLLDSLGSPTQKQLAKRYTFGSETFDRRLTKIVANTFTAVGGSGVTLDYDTGLLTYSSEPTAFSCEFDVPVRFDVDELRAETINKSGDDLIIGWSSIPLVEVRV